MNVVTLRHNLSHIPEDVDILIDDEDEGIYKAIKSFQYDPHKKTLHITINSATLKELNSSLGG